MLLPPGAVHVYEVPAPGEVELRFTVFVTHVMEPVVEAVDVGIALTVIVVVTVLVLGQAEALVPTIE